MQDNLPNILSITGNLIVQVRQVHQLARDQFANEHKEGSRSSSRGLLLAEIGTSLQGIEHELKTITANIDMIKELPLQIDPEAVEKPEVYQVF